MSVYCSKVVKFYMYFKDKLDFINAYSMHKCIHNFWQYASIAGCNIARIPTILPEFRQYLFACEIQYCRNVAAILPETVAAILPQYCGSILPEGLYFDKGYHIASFYDIVHLRFWTVDWVLFVDNYTHANLW